MKSNQRDREHDGTGPAPFDYKRSLARLGGDPVLFDEVVALFLEDSPQLLEQARQGLSENDHELLARSAHSLKNLSANFDAEALTEAAATVEQQTLEGGLDRAAACFEDMQRELHRLQAALAALPKTNRTS